MGAGGRDSWSFHWGSDLIFGVGVVVQLIEWVFVIS